MDLVGRWKTVGRLRAASIILTHTKGEVLGVELSSWMELNIVDGVMEISTFRVVKDE